MNFPSIYQTMVAIVFNVFDFGVRNMKKIYQFKNDIFTRVVEIFCMH